jgi:hypothetical protein
MNASVKSLVWASIVNLVGNGLGAIIAIQHNLISDLGGTLRGQDPLRDFLGTQGTALSAPLLFMVIQLVFTGLALRSGRSRTIGVIGLTLVGLLYTPAQAGERIVMRLLSPGGFDLLQFIVALINIASAVAMLVLGIRAWITMRATRSARSQSAAI